MTLLGPTDADHFRIKVGRYNDRWYTDPLPACDLAPATEWRGPSVSTTKPPFANKYVTLRGVADMPSDEWARLARLDADGRYEAVKAADKAASRINMDRGSLVHQRGEDRMRARMALPITRYSANARAAAERFYPALDAFFDTFQPKPVALEVVCLHRTLNGVGYGGTADAFLEIDGAVWCVDYKSRNSGHAAYLEEGCQGGAYAGAEYMIVADENGNAIRTAIPEVAGVLIVSIREDGFRCFPVDADKATAAYAEMHRWWVAQRTFDDGAIGQPWGPRSGGEVADASSIDRSELVDAARALVAAGHGATLARRWPDGVPGLGTEHEHTAAELAAIAAVVLDLNKRESMPFTALEVTPGDPSELAPRDDPPHTTTVDIDGNPVTVDARDALNDRFSRLSADAQAVVLTVREQMPAWTTVAGVPPRERHWCIMRALVLWAGVWDDDIVRDIVAAVCGDEGVRQPGIEIGAAFAALTIDQATDLADMAQRVLDGTHRPAHTDRWTLVPAA